MNKETILSVNDVFDMLDTLLKEQSRFEWDHFYSDRDKGIPFFKDVPDENLVEYLDKHFVKPGRVLELGCGPGRNATYLAEKGFKVDAVDSSSEALQWAEERAKEKGLSVNFLNSNIFELAFEEPVDFIYDSGCFHHVAPHRRISYLDLLNKNLKPGGYFALTCFVENGEFGGSDMTDYDVYREKSLKGGLGFTEDKLRRIFSNFHVVEIRKMRDVEEHEPLFGLSGLWSALFQKK